MADVNDDLILNLIDDDGTELAFELLLEFEYGGEPFIAFTPLEPMENFDVGEVLIMREGEDEQGEVVYLPIDSQEELEELWQAFKGLYYEDDELDEEEVEIDLDDEEDYSDEEEDQN